MIFETDFMKLYEELGEINVDNTEHFEEILDELKKFDYAFIDKNGKELPEDEAMKAYVQSPEQLANLGKGVCTDFVEYTKVKLDELDIPFSVYNIKCTDKDGDQPAHVFVVAEVDDKFYWLEAAWHSEAGVHEYKDILELFEDIARKHCIYDGENYLESCEIREIKKSLVGMSQDEIYDYIETLSITWKAAEEGITEDLETLTYKEVSDTELFKEYADDILDGYGGLSDSDIKRDIKEIHIDGKLAGYIGFSEYEEDGHKCLGIGNFMIIERGRGFGSAVIQDIVEKYKNQYDLIYCFVDAKNDDAIRLYKKLGKVYDEDGPNDNGEYYVTFYDNGNWELNEGKKNKKVVSIQSASEVDLDSFLKDLGLAPISMIAPACSDTSPSGATVWAPAEPHSGGSYKKAIPQFEVISTKRLPRLVATLDDTEFPNKMFTTDDIQNNGGRKLKEVRIGDVQNNPCRGLWFRTRSGNKRYFIFGSIFYKNTQKINAATNSEVAQANKIYDAVMKKLGNH